MCFNGRWRSVVRWSAAEMLRAWTRRHPTGCKIAGHYSAATPRRRNYLAMSGPEMTSLHVTWSSRDDARWLINAALVRNASSLFRPTDSNFNGRKSPQCRARGLCIASSVLTRGPGNHKMRFFSQKRRDGTILLRGGSDSMSEQGALRYLPQFKAVAHSTDEVWAINR